MSLVTVLAILFIHWVADFLFQDVEWANNKSKDNTALEYHVLTYTLIMMLGIGILFSSIYNLIGTLLLTLLFGFITYIAHFSIDYTTSRIVAKKFAKKEYGTHIPNTGAFTVIGFDQFLHFVQLFLTYQLLT